MWSTKVQQLREQCAAVDRLVDRRATAQAGATARYIRAPDDPDAYADMLAAEELCQLARYRQRKVWRALRRAERRRSVVAYLFSWLSAGQRTHRSFD